MNKFKNGDKIMRILTTVILTSVFLISATSAKGEIIFDLKNQYFSGTLIKKDQENFNKEYKYDVGKVLVTTDTVFYDPAYKFGIFTVDIKEPLANWNVNIKKKNGTYEETTTIRLTSDIGESYFIVFNHEYGDNSVIQINDKTFKGIGKQELRNQNLTLSVSAKGEKIIFKINGKVFLKSSNKDFGKLSKVEVELNDNKYDDELLALDVSKVN